MVSVVKSTLNKCNKAVKLKTRLQVSNPTIPTILPSIVLVIGMRFALVALKDIQKFANTLT